jgi:uncharacterized spore protein YtfJ
MYRGELINLNFGDVKMTDFTRNKNVIHEVGTVNTKIFESINKAKKESRRLQKSGKSVSKA